MVGRTPWSARDASSRIRHNDISILQAREADGGVVPRGDPRTRGSAPPIMQTVRCLEN